MVHPKSLDGATWQPVRNLPDDWQPVWPVDPPTVWQRLAVLLRLARRPA
jgi:hypothetical protein